MIRPLHESDHTVGKDGTLSLRNLKPGARVHVVVVESSEDGPEWGLGSIPESRIYKPGKPRLLWGALKGTITRYDRPFDPACDPDEWEANR